MRFLKVTVFIISICSLLQGCCSLNKIRSEEDIVNSSKRITWHNTYFGYNNFSPLDFLDQSIVKEIKANKEITYKVYDVLTLNNKSFQVEDKVFVIIDSTVYSMKLDGKEYSNERNFTEDKKNIQTSDSTKISVTTEYSENNKKITRFSYELNSEIINKLKSAKQILFRYYSGPSIITVGLQKKKLDSLKKLLDIL